jgi:hypothetical protein
MFMTYNTTDGTWEIDYLDDDRDSDLLRLTSGDDWARTRSGATMLDWSVAGDSLVYRLENGDEHIETGRFKRQVLENH